MKAKTWKRVLSIGLVLMTAAVMLTGCQSKSASSFQLEAMKPEKAPAYSFEFIGGTDVMPIGGYYGPYVTNYSEDAQTPPDYITDEIWKMVADCGVNLMTYSIADYASNSQAVFNNLNYGEKYGIAVTVYDSKIHGMGSKPSLDELTIRLSNYMNYPAFAGVYLIDEPSTDYFKPVGRKELGTRYLDYYRNLAPMLNREIGMFTYTNAYPSGFDAKEHEVYEQYIREFYDTLQPNYMLFDRYPFDAGHEGYMSRFFSDLAIVRMVAEEKGVPFWTFVQAGSQWNDAMEHFDSVTPYYPTEGQFDWNVNVCLAFGAKGINFFPLIQPYFFAFAESEPFDFERNGLIGAWGNKTQWYYYAQDITKQIREVDEVLMNATSKGVLAYGEQAKADVGLAKNYGAVMKGTGWRELKNVEGDALVGCFNYQGKTALYVVNYSTDHSQQINLHFQDNYKVTVIQNADTKDIQGEGMTLDMLPGEGALLVFQ